MDANTLVATTTKSTATIRAASVTDSAYDTVVVKSLDDPGNTLTRRTNWFFDNLDSSDTYHDLVLFDKLMVTRSPRKNCCLMV